MSYILCKSDKPSIIIIIIMSYNTVERIVICVPVVLFALFVMSGCLECTL